MSEVVVTLIGVLVGFALSEGKSFISEYRSRKQLRKALSHEIKSIVRLIPSKLDILEQAKDAYSSARILPASSTRVPRQIYDQIILSAPDLLSSVERDCLHVIYERMRIIDASMDTIEKRFNQIKSAHDLGSAINATLMAIADLKNSLVSTKEMVSMYLDGKPVDVYALGINANKSVKQTG